MAPLISPISISFLPILRDICACLGLPKPIYSIANVAENEACVIVLKETHPDSFVFHGDKGNTLQDSYESAAEKMVLFLVRKYKIIVVDANLEDRRSIEEGVQLFKMKRDAFEAMDQQVPSRRSTTLSSIKGVHSSPYIVEVDFLAMFRTVVEKTQAQITPIEVMALSEMQYKAWLTLACIDSVNDFRCLAGDITPTAEAAKQYLAMKVVRELMQMYHFDVMDVNYFFLSAPRLVLKCEREKYITLKEKVHGLVEEMSAQPMVIEKDQLTPRGEQNRIIIGPNPPLPPKKRKMDYLGKSLAVTIPECVDLAKMQGIFKQKKKE